MNPNTKHFDSFRRLNLLCVSASVEAEKKKSNQNLKPECEVLRISWSKGCKKKNSVRRTMCSQSTAAAPVIYSECVRCIRVALMAQLCPKKITACQQRAQGRGSVARRRLAPQGIFFHAKLKHRFFKTSVWHSHKMTGDVFLSSPPKSLSEKLQIYSDAFISLGKGERLQLQLGCCSWCSKLPANTNSQTQECVC